MPEQGSIQQLNLLLLITQGQWGVTAAEEEEESRRIREFQDSIPKMCSQLRILTHFYQVSVDVRAMASSGTALASGGLEMWLPLPSERHSEWSSLGVVPCGFTLALALLRAAIQLG